MSTEVGGDGFAYPLSFCSTLFVSYAASLFLADRSEKAKVFPLAALPGSLFTLLGTNQQRERENAFFILA